MEREVDLRESDASLRCPECGAVLVVQATADRAEDSGTATCSACRAIFDLEGLACAPAELDVLSDESLGEIRRTLL